MVTASDMSASFLWMNQALDPSNLPTDVQYRISSTTSVWAEKAYPAAAASVGFLQPATEYVFQARYVIRESGVITATGPISELFFTTNALSGPGTPAADPGGTGPDSTVPVGPTDGTGGTVGGGDCWWEWVVQEPTAPLDIGAIVWQDTAVTDSVDGDATSFDVDLVAEGLSCGGLLRFKYREVCNGVPDDWQYRDPFIAPCDWSDPCGGIAGNATLGAAPFDDAILAMPKACVNGDDPLRIEDMVVTGAEYGKFEGFESIYLDGDFVIVSKDDCSIYGSPVVAGTIGPLSNLATGDDATFAFAMQLTTQPPAVLGGSRVASFGKNVNFRAYGTGSGFKVGVTIAVDGGSISIESITELDLDAWHIVSLTVDADGNKQLYLNGVVDTVSTDTTNPDWDGFGMRGDVELYGNVEAGFRKVAVWDRILTGNEIVAMGKINPYYANGEALGATAALSADAGFDFTDATISPAVGDFVMCNIRISSTSETATLDTASALEWKALPDDGATSIAGNGSFYRIWDGTESWPTFDVHGASTFERAIAVFKNVDPDNPFSGSVETSTKLVTGGGNSIYATAYSKQRRWEDPTDTVFDMAFKRTTAFGIYWLGNALSPTVNTALPYSRTDTELYSTLPGTTYRQHIIAEGDYDAVTADWGYDGGTKITAVASITSTSRLRSGGFVLQAPRADGDSPYEIVSVSGASGGAFSVNFSTTSRMWENARPGDIVLMTMNGSTPSAWNSTTQYEYDAVTSAMGFCAVEYVDWATTPGSNIGPTFTSGASNYVRCLLIRGFIGQPTMETMTGWYTYEDPAATSYPAGTPSGPTTIDTITPAAADRFLWYGFKQRPTGPPTIDKQSFWSTIGGGDFTAGGGDGVVWAAFGVAPDTSAIDAPEASDITSNIWAGAHVQLIDDGLG